jgi:hypothetical protein
MRGDAKKVIGPTQDWLAKMICPPNARINLAPVIDDWPFADGPRLLIIKITLKSGCPKPPIIKYWIQINGQDGTVVHFAEFNPASSAAADVALLRLVVDKLIEYCATK